MSKQRNDRTRRRPEAREASTAARTPKEGRDGEDLSLEVDEIVVGDELRARPGRRWVFWEALDQETEQ